MWRPLEIFLYDWWPIRSEAQLSDRLAAMPVRIRYLDVKSPDAWKGDCLMLFCLRALRPGLPWKERPLAIAFWSINIGLAAMVLLSMLRVGLMQAGAFVEFGTWYARSAEFLQTPLLSRLRWMRMFGDSLFAFGAIVLGWFVLGLVTGHSFENQNRSARRSPNANWQLSLGIRSHRQTAGAIFCSALRLFRFDHGGWQEDHGSRAALTGVTRSSSSASCGHLVQARTKGRRTTSREKRRIHAR